MDMSPALLTFVAECNELLEQLEQSLLDLENQPGDRELLDAVFRSAHTIKGSAGMFGFDGIVGFTHGVENLLDRVRGGEIQLDAVRTALLLRCADHIKHMIEPSVNDQPLDAVALASGAQLTHEINAILEPPQATLLGTVGADDLGKLLSDPTPVAGPARASMADDFAVLMQDSGSSPAPGTGSALWRIELKFGQEVLRNGMDPLSFLRYLSTLGEVVKVHVGADRLPSLDDFDPEACYLDLQIDFDSTAEKAAIESVFDFVRDDCEIRIVPPVKAVAAQLAAIEAHEEASGPLGSILLKANAVTQAELADALQVQAAATEPTALGQILINNAGVPEQVVDAALDRQQQSRSAKHQESRLIRIDADKLDQLINVVGELVIAGSGTQALAARAGLADVVESAASLLRLVEEVRDSALGLRMVAIGATFQRFHRVVRDTSRELGKDIELAVSGADTELDKSVVERIADPLMHLVRNAMDHGIEPALARVAAGKSARATVSLNAYHDSGNIVIEVGDDGGGLNVEKIRLKAIERGLLSPTANASAQEIRQLIFEPGFSTADTISNISGRGVGMDVVRRSIEALRGTIEIRSEEGRGTTVLIRLPLTLAIIDGFMVGLGRSRFVLPLDAVVECIELTNDYRRAVNEQGFINMRGEVLPVMRLREVFQIPDERDALLGTLGEERGSGRRENVVVVRSAGIKAGLVVDALLGELQTVIKPLGKLFSYLNGISGSTILGSGEVALILDVPGLIKQVEHIKPVSLAAV